MFNRRSFLGSIIGTIGSMCFSALSLAWEPPLIPKSKFLSKWRFGVFDELSKSMFWAPGVNDFSHILGTMQWQVSDLVMTRPVIIEKGIFLNDKGLVLTRFKLFGPVHLFNDETLKLTYTLNYIGQKDKNRAEDRLYNGFGLPIPSGV